MKKLELAAALAVAVLIAAGSFWSLARAPLVEKAASRQDPDPSLLFVGDIMLDRAVAVHAIASTTAPLFAQVLDLFKVADANVANLEGAITLNPSIAQRNPTILHFTFNPTLAHDALAPLHLAAASQANNHAYDFGATGYDSTRQYLTEWGIAPFGHPYNATSSLSTVLDIRGKKFCLVGYHSLYNPSTASVVEEIKRLKPDCYRIIVMAHWGVEYEPVANLAQMGQAHEFIDAGADLVVGAHPHVVENVGVYKGKAIFYSLGNCMFDQNFSWATTHGLAVTVTFAASTTSFSLTPLSAVNEEAAVANEPDRQRVLKAAGRLAEFSLP